jgi:hypothetical protein
MPKTFAFSDDQRLIAYTVVSNQRGSLSETRANNRLLDYLEFDDERLRRAAAEARTVHILAPAQSALRDSGSGIRAIELPDDQAERLGRLLSGWDSYSAADVDPVIEMVEAFTERAPQLRRSKNFNLFLTLQARLQLTLFTKQIAGPLEEAQRWASIAFEIALTEAEIERIRFRAFATGTAQWNSEAIRGASTKTVILTESDAELLLKRIHRHENWATTDVAWLSDVLAQLEAPGKEGDAALSAVPDSNSRRPALG